MYARTTTFRGHPRSLDAGIAYVRDAVLPAVRDMEGCVGLAMLVDRSTGRCIVTTSWADEEALRRSGEAVGSLREAAARILLGADGEPQVATWTVGVLHRVRPAPATAACRVIWTKGPLGCTERVVDTVRDVMVPRLDDLAGVCSMSVLIDDATGRAAMACVYEDRQTMNRAKGQARAIREQFTDRVGMHVTEIAEFDLVLAHLRVPATV
ncbi:MAG: antibiotic biosynthesis monooxygenase [Actinomycetes bacterium]